MDLLCNAYSNSSDEEPETVPRIDPQSKPLLGPHQLNTVLPPPKRPKRNNNPLQFSSEAPIPGRYISKRERALMGQSASASNRVIQDPNPYPPFPTSSDGAMK
ncbi:conserved hypothetical protein [Ricinus communis]|uniref:Uncharacterized protein n=1 Tax=Ricinus communis TaxID=3988 RepID=B9T673_RICCO|nr:conserved hypothetical protein [Ricinus communis]